MKDALLTTAQRPAGAPRLATAVAVAAATLATALTCPTGATAQNPHVTDPAAVDPAAVDPERHLSRDGELTAEVRHEREASSPEDDFSPALYTGRVVFASARKPEAYRTVLVDKEHDQNFTSVFVADVAADTAAEYHLGEAEAFDDRLNDVFHDACPSFTADGQTVFYTRSQSRGARRVEGADGYMHLGIYTARREGGKWSKPELVSFCGPEHNDMHPAINADGTEMYFTSDREGGFGETDLYYVTRDSGGAWSRPVNLGPQVNRDRREAFPFLAADGSLYFSSDDPDGLGGYDVYRTRRTRRGGYEVATALPAPVNGPADDFGLVLGDDGATGFFASARAGGAGGDDLYGVTLVEAPLRAPEGTFLAAIGGDADSVLAGVSIEARAIGTALLPGEGLVDSFTVVTGDSGVASVDLAAGFGYDVVVAGPGIDTLRTTVWFDPETYTATLPVTRARPVDALAGNGEAPGDGGEAGRPLAVGADDLKAGAVIALPNIFYDFDATAIRADARPDLDSVIAVMARFPSLVIELRSHTDARGSRAYNRRLSEGRAASAVAYLLAGGVPAERVRSRGFGKDIPRVACRTAAACTESDHQLNRRTEIRVVSVDAPEGVRIVGRVTGDGGADDAAEADADEVEAPGRR